MMTHPGFSVTNKKFSGEVRSIDPTFLEFLDRYCERVFGAGANLIPKAILGREVTAIELIAYIKAYTRIFEDGAHFPEASTMLDATVNANNANAISLTLNFYKDEMEKVAGVRCSDYLHQDEFNIIHENAYNDSINMFDEIANFGSQTSINVARDEVQRAITDSFEIYSKLNNSRNPLLGFQIYIMPILIACFSIVLRWAMNSTCTDWSYMCKVSSDFLSHIFQVIFFFMLIITATKAKQISQAFKRLSNAVYLIQK